MLSRFKPHLIVLGGLALSLIAVPPAVGADLDDKTAQAYERRLAVVTQAFAKQTDGEAFLQQATPEALARMRRGEILLTAGTGNGITDVPKGLFHHWRAAAFVPDVTLERLLAIVQDYTTYWMSTTGSSCRNSPARTAIDSAPSFASSGAPEW